MYKQVRQLISTISCLMVGYLCLHSSAQAEQTTELTSELLLELGVMENIEEKLETLLGGAVQGIRSDYRCLPDESEPELRERFLKVFSLKKISKRLNDLIAPEFTEQELTEIVAFVKTPAGKKVVKLMPTIWEKVEVVAKKMVGDNLLSFKSEVQHVLDKYMKQNGQCIR